MFSFFQLKEIYRRKVFELKFEHVDYTWRLEMDRPFTALVVEAEMNIQFAGQTSEALFSSIR